VTPGLTVPYEPLARHDFEWLRSWVQDRSGVCIRDDQEYLVDARLSPVARAESSTPAGIVRRLRQADPRIETAVIDAMTTNETSWFRDIGTFKALEERVIPERLEARRLDQTLNVWVPAVSSGQELLSLAMLLRECFPELHAGWRTTLLGTDIATSMVARCQDGRYSQMEVDRGLPSRYLVKYFERERHRWAVRREIHQMAKFSQQNLVCDQPPGMFDLIMCRYVLIYFDEQTRVRVVEKLVSALRPGGVLMLGAGEIGGRAVAGLRQESHGKGVFYAKP